MTNTDTSLACPSGINTPAASAKGGRCIVDDTSKVALGETFSGITAPGADGIVLSASGLIVDGNLELTPQKYNTLFSTVLSLSKSCNWLLGDTLLLADRTWGNRFTGSKYEEAAAATGLSLCTIRNIVSTCKLFPREQRHADLSFTHHREAVRLVETPEVLNEVLQQASDEHMSVKSLRKEIVRRKHILATTAPSETDDAPVADAKPKKRDVLGFELLGLPECVSPDAPPMWDILKFHQWIKKTDAYEFDREKCEKALELLEPILDFHADVKARLAELDEEQPS